MKGNNGYWPYRVEVGDVISNGKSFRVVRGVVQGNGRFTAWVDLVIQRCSWTNRPYTTISYVDLQNRGFVPVKGKRVILDRHIDREISRDISDIHRRHLHCCDVLGLP